MPRRELRYFFGRLNLIANYTDKREFLLRALQTSKIIFHRGNNWGFFEAKETETEFGLFISGFLVKYKGEIDEEVAVPETHSLTDIAAANRVVAKSRFFLHIESGLIAYHPVANKIGNETFCERFVQLFEEALDKFFVSADIQAIEERYKIFEAIRRFKTISKVFVYLHPSNPRSTKRWKRIDDRLKRLGASKYQEQYESKPNGDGLDIIRDPELKSKITMADDGYGKAEVTGQIEGETRTISTRDNPITALAANDDQPPESVISKLGSALKKIFSRFRK